MTLGGVVFKLFSCPICSERIEDFLLLAGEVNRNGPKIAHNDLD